MSKAGMSKEKTYRILVGRYKIGKIVKNKL